MKILMITPFFYPQNVIAVSRVGQWTKYLSRLGHDVTVLTTKKYPFWQLDYNIEMPSNVDIVEVDFLPSIVKKLLGLSGTQSERTKYRIESNSKVKKTLREYKSKFTKYFDPHDLWISPASKTGLAMASVEKFELIISSYSPAAAHHVAKAIKRKNIDSVWIADFRDLWAKNHLSTHGYVRRYFEYAREKHCIQDADILVTISDTLAEAMKESYPKKNIEVIPNGYDHEDYSGFHINTYGTHKSESRTIISYTGMIYEGKRDPSPLLLAINQLIEAGDIHKEDFIVNFYGPSKNIIDKIVTNGNFNKNNFINVYDQVSRDRASEIQRTSDILLLLEWPDKRARGVLTGKLFEYLISGKPILGVGVHPQSEAGLLIAKTQSGFVSNDVDEIKKLLISFNENKKFESFNPNMDEIKKYSRNEQVLKLINIYENYIKGQPQI
jgi:glycosyltransferase involved in cell wall biosynthesis